MTESLSDMSLNSFTGQLASRAPVPGGGGAAALIGALAAALGSMATNLTLGKKKYLPYEAEHRRILEETGRLRLRFLALTEEDAAAFAPLSEAYALDRSVPENAERFRLATLAAARAPMEMMERCGELIALLESLRDKCSVLLLSDVGCAALAARTALEAAAMNVFVNTRALPGDGGAAALADRAGALLREYQPRAQALSDSVTEWLRTP